jgi:hypothetical protein
MDQAISHTDDPLGQGAIRTQHLVFDGQIVGLVGTEEAEAGEPMLWLLGHEAKLVIVGLSVMALVPSPSQRLCYSFAPGGCDIPGGC